MFVARSAVSADLDTQGFTGCRRDPKRGTLTSTDLNQAQKCAYVIGARFLVQDTSLARDSGVNAARDFACVTSLRREKGVDVRHCGEIFFGNTRKRLREFRL
jgi:hypothetical protein